MLPMKTVVGFGLIVLQIARAFLLDRCPTNSVYSAYSACYEPANGSAKKNMVELMQDKALQLCPKPSRENINMTFAAFTSSTPKNYSAHPLVSRLSSYQCGLCAKEIRCCVERNNINNFFNQKLETRPCHTSTTNPCFLRNWPVTREDPRTAPLAAELAQWHANFDVENFTAAPCDFSLMWPEVEDLRASPVYKSAGPLGNKLLCTFINSSRPSFNCKTIRTFFGPQCACCCTEFEPEESGPNGYQCVYKGRRLNSDC